VQEYHGKLFAEILTLKDKALTGSRRLAESEVLEPRRGEKIIVSQDEDTKLGIL